LAERKYKRLKIFKEGTGSEAKSILRRGTGSETENILRGGRLRN
jgi:hypothetical protein